MSRTDSEEKTNSRSGDRNRASEKSRDKDRKLSWGHFFTRLPLLLLIPLGLLLPQIAKSSPEKVETVYSRSIYPVVSRIVGFVSSLVPTSLAEILIVGVSVLLVVMLLVRVLSLVFGKFRNRRRNRMKFFNYILTLGIIAGLLLTLFYGMWGLNYYRLSAPELLGIQVRRYSNEELQTVCIRLAQEAAELREQVNEDENGVFTVGDRRTAMHTVVDAYSVLGSDNELFSNKAYPAKTVLLSKGLSKLDIAGIFIPFTAECNVNAEQPDLYFLAGAAHETAHYFGFAREDEANFLSFYVSEYSEDVNLRYSATMLALNYCADRLYNSDKDMYYEVRGYYSDGMVRDLADYSAYYQKYAEDPAQKVGDNMNDAYLKYNGQSDGLNSYGRMVDLMLAYYLPPAE